MQLADGDWEQGTGVRRPAAERLLPLAERTRHRPPRSPMRPAYLWRLTRPGRAERIVALHAAGLLDAQSRVQDPRLFPDAGAEWALAPLGEGTWAVEAEGTVLIPRAVSLDEEGFAYGPIPRLPS